MVFVIDELNIIKKIRISICPLLCQLLSGSAGKDLSKSLLIKISYNINRLGQISHLCRISGILIQFAAATAANGTYLCISGGAFYNEDKKLFQT